MQYMTNPYTGQQYFTMPQQQIQNGGFVSVRNIDEARSYPIAPGNSIMFKDETAPYVYTKTVGFSQLDRPVFEKYRLIKEEDAQEPHMEPKAEKARNAPSYALKTDLDEVSHAVEDIRDEIAKLKEELEAGV